MQPFSSSLRSESGMTIVELMVAAMICVVGLLSTVAVLDQSRKVGDEAEARETVAHQADRELERLLGLSWATLGHTGTGPAPTGTAPDPGSYVSASTPRSFRFDRKNEARAEWLVVLPGGVVENAPTDFTDNQDRLSGKVHRYVTEVNTQTRRVTVAVTADPPANVPPVYLSTLVTDPRP